MLIGKLHPGSGIGDQLFSYITTRTIALDKGYDFGFVGKEYFKGKDFMNLDWGLNLESVEYHIEQSSGKLILDQPAGKVFEFNKPYYDPEVNFIKDGTIIDGTGAQDERYWGHRLDEIREWLKVDPLYKSHRVWPWLCVINFRGGEYTSIPELFLLQEYWDKAIQIIFIKDSRIQFEVHTDDPITAKQFFPRFPIVSNIEKNWRAIRHAKYLILSNSAFGIFPALLNENAECIIAPKYWAGKNVGEWRRPQNYYKKFTYI